MRAVSSLLKITTVLGVLGGLVAATEPAAARTLKRCDDAHCYRVYCHDGVCVRRSYEYGRYMNGRDYDYDHNGYYDVNGDLNHDDPSLPVERYLCDSNGERCHWGRTYDDAARN